jgi:hypothetical protein
MSDTVSRLLYYDRKEDSQLPLGAIEKAITKGEISVDEIVAFMEAELRKGLTT